MAARFEAVFVDDTRQGTWAITDSQVYDDRYISFGVVEDKARFGAMLLNNEGIGQVDTFQELEEELDHALADVRCEVCDKVFMRAQLHNDRCPADLQ